MENEQDSVDSSYEDVDCPDDELVFNMTGIEKDMDQGRVGAKSIPKTWILLDSQSTIDLACNPALLTDIHHVDQCLTIRCNAGKTTTHWRGTMSGYGEVWYYPAGIANILSLSRVKDKFRVTFDSAADNAFHVHKPEKTLIFREATRRLYYFDTASRDEYADVLVTTVSDNKSKFSAYDYSQAKLARSLQRRIGRPSLRDFLRYVNDKAIPDCPITATDIGNAEIIFGPDLGSLKGKTAWRQPSRVRTDVTNIPYEIMEQYRHVRLSINVMNVTNIPFLTSISEHIKFGTASKLNNMKNETIIKHIVNITRLYHTRGFKIAFILGDGQFESLHGDIANLHIQLNIVSND
jgi:hypothetical protein